MCCKDAKDCQTQVYYSQASMPAVYQPSHSKQPCESILSNNNGNNTDASWFEPTSLDNVNNVNTNTAGNINSSDEMNKNTAYMWTFSWIAQWHHLYLHNQSRCFHKHVWQIFMLDCPLKAMFEAVKVFFELRPLLVLSALSI